MSRFRRKKAAEQPDAPSTGFDAEFTDVKIVKRTRVGAPADDATGDAGDTPDDAADGSGDVISELSAAFSADDDPTEPTGAVRPEAELTTIAIGGDDDLPDAVYLDDELGLGDESDTVFIDDDGTGDAVLPKDATGPGIEPRIRQRRIGVRRAEGRKRLKWFVIVGLVAVVVIGLLAVLGSSLFAVDDVDITGLRSADVDAVAAVVEDIQGTPTLLVDVDDAERRLEAIPWIETARVRTDFPSSATIEIRERVAVATTRGPDGRFRILDAEGRVLDVIDGQPVAFVLITGSLAADLPPGSFADTGTAAATSLSVKLGPAVRSRLVSISTVPDGSDLRLMLSNDEGNDIEVRLGAAIGDNDQLERLVRLDRVLSDITGSETTIIDVSTAETTCLPSCTG